MIRRKILTNAALIAALMAPPHLIAGPKPGEWVSDILNAKAARAR
ncbi:hypothetical protein [Halovulum sp. GXIMD14793]